MSLPKKEMRYKFTELLNPKTGIVYVSDAFFDQMWEGIEKYANYMPEAGGFKTSIFDGPLGIEFRKVSVLDMLGGDK